MRDAISEVYNEVVMLKGQVLEEEKHQEILRPMEILDRNYFSPTARYRVASSFGFTVCIIVSTVDEETKYNVFFRSPLTRSSKLNLSITCSWTSWIFPSAIPRFRIQNIIQETSLIVGACRRGDLDLMSKLFFDGMAHPNDTTTENQTLLNVRMSFSNGYVKGHAY
jgi:hypothetical protein